MSLCVCSSGSLHNTEESDLALLRLQKTVCVDVKTAVCDVLETIKKRKKEKDLKYSIKFFQLN